MYAHRIETTVDETSRVKLGVLPFVPGDQVEVIILKRESAEEGRQPAVSFAQVAKAFCGTIDQAPADLSTNPAHFEDFGK